MEAIRNRELADWLNVRHVFPVSPDTLLMTLQTIALVHKWYEVASRFEKAAWSWPKPRNRLTTSRTSSKPSART